MSTAQRWDKFPGGSDLTYDAVTGFQGKPTNYEWKYLGRKELLCARQAKDSIQEIKDKPIGACDQLYQRVNTVMVEYIPKDHVPPYQGRLCTLIRKYMPVITLNFMTKEEDPIFSCSILGLSKPVDIKAL